MCDIILDNPPEDARIVAERAVRAGDATHEIFDRRRSSREANNTECGLAQRFGLKIPTKA